VDLDVRGGNLADIGVRLPVDGVGVQGVEEALVDIPAVDRSDLAGISWVPPDMTVACLECSAR
jgi:hypothetical protein